MATDSTPAYDEIGRGYTRYRTPDPRIARLIDAALGDAKSIVNIGAGAGAYEPRDRQVVAVEPSSEMIAQRAEGAAPVIQGSAESLPFENNSFDAAMAVLTIHHWRDLHAGLSEMRRVARDRIVLLTWDPDSPPFWLVRDYFPEIYRIDREILPPLPTLQQTLGHCEIHPVPVPHDCIDGFLGAYWRRPEAYLDEGVRGAISTFSRVRGMDSGLASGLDRLRHDIESGEWSRRNADILDRDELDVGYRLVIWRR